MTHRFEDVVSRLVPLESYRSPLVPSLRFGAPSLVGIAEPIVPADSDFERAPTYWYAMDPTRSSLYAFARTSLLSPVVEFAPGPLRTATPPMHPREAHAVIRQRLPLVQEAFFAGHRAEQPAALIEQAYAATIPTGLQSWIRLCCADFFAWLAL
jgi:hypothetical protein